MATDDELAAARAKIHKARPASDDPARETGAGTDCDVCGWRIRRVPSGQGTIWVHSETGAVVAGGGEGGRAQIARHPVDPELFARTAPAWNCVDYPGEGMHYLNRAGGCQWCGMTREQIAAERAGGVSNG